MNLQRRWDLHFIALALQWASMSKDPDTQIGAVFVGPDHEELSSGFNGLPRGIQDLPERLNNKVEKLRLIVHAEINAVMNAARRGVALQGSTLYIACTDASGLVWGGAPCTRCTVELIQTGLVEVVSYPFKEKSRWKADVEHAEQLLGEAAVRYREVPLIDLYEPWKG